ncbi:MAG: response regulator [Anaerolineae bacterium]|nr:response regulator [Anaerolineae bacterium]MDW8100290.1 response regulator [Anaerolineae bacterium]
MSPRILVIDDDHDSRLFLKLTLQPYGHQILDSVDIAQGLNLARRKDLDLIILEAGIGGGAGFDLCRRLRLLPGGRSLPILILSYLRHPEDVVRGLQAGANGYITKPADPAELVARVHALLGYRQTPQPRVTWVLGVKGGVGATTLAVNLGVALAHHWRERVVLVDAEIPGGDAAIHLGLRPSHTLADLISYGHMVDAEVVERVMCRHRSGLQLITAPPAELGQPLEPEFLTPIVQAMTGRQEHVIVDCPPLSRDHIIALARLSDRILLVVTPESTALFRAITLLNALSSSREGNSEGAQIQLVINDADRAGGIPMEHLPARLKPYPIARLSSDVRDVLSSINTGEPLVLSAPRTRLSREIVQLARSCRRETAEDEDISAPAERVRSWWSRLRPGKHSV